ncbi:hypothetical protein B0T19DRAFT_446084 [Cercophora scortea]|uniref:Uncharacterized protein n=1 Tax=Cercophora scortea TaxID=314031 RepID=A0AAE0I828_9PEZI|nr:hypothetical protein B0T19DRAFT_446084 [Cercophora scortea]
MDDYKGFKSSSDDVNQVFEYSYYPERTNPSKKRPPFWRFWAAEIFFSLTIIVAVLGAYDGKALPRLPMSITLNTFLAFFTTFTKAAFMTPVSEAISQWKWNMFAPRNDGSHGRSLADFQILDAASRGTWGSWVLMYNFRHFVCFAAVFSIVSIFTSPVTQQMIVYATRPAIVPGEATVAYTRVVDNVDSVIKGSIARADYTAMMSTVDNPIENVHAKCSSANCTFDRYKSLAVCMKIKDISEFVHANVAVNYTYADWMGDNWPKQPLLNNNNTPVWNATLPNGLYLLTPLSYAFITAPSDDPIVLNESHNDNFTALGRFFHIYSNAGNISYPGYYNLSTDTEPKVPWEFRAAEILYYACVNTYETQVVSGNSTTRVVSSTNVPLPIESNKPLYNAKCYTSPSFDTQFCEHADPDDMGGDTYLQDPDDPDDPTKNFSISRAYAFEFTKNVYYDLLNAYWSDGVQKHDDYWFSQADIAVREALYGDLWTTTGPAKGAGNYTAAQQIANLGVYYQSTATSLSNEFRTIPDISTVHRGAAWGEETYVSVVWGWAAFLAAQMLLSYLFLAITMVRTARLKMPVLKSSELATLILSADEVRAAVGTVGDLRDAESRAKTMYSSLTAR